MLECLSVRDEGALRLTAKGNINITKLNDVFWERITQFPTISTIISEFIIIGTGLTTTTNIGNG